MSESPLIPLKALDAAATVPTRANPMIWEGDAPAEGVFLDAGDPLALLGTPSFALPELPKLPEDFTPSAALTNWLDELMTALTAASADATRDALVRTLSLAALNDNDRLAVHEILGRGEVDGQVTLDGVRYEIHESVLAGVWRVSGDDGSEVVEVGAVPGVVTAAAESLETAPFAIPAPGPEHMNGPAVLAELSERGADCAETLARGKVPESHVVNFTLLPTTEADQALITAVLGRANLELTSGGFGDCRVMATRYRHLWAVQYVNAMEHTILDTIEVGTVPGAVRAAQEDFEDSAARLAEIREAYLA